MTYGSWVSTAPRLEPEDALQLVAQARADVVGLGLERHAEHADAHAREVVALLQPGDDVQRQALVDRDAGLAEVEVVVVERGELHRVLEQARPGGEARTREIGGPRIVVGERRADPLVVEAEVVGHHVELVRRRELDVAPRVREQLGQLGLFGLEVHDVVGQVAEQLAGTLERTRRPRRDDLGELEELDHRLAFGDALRAERHVDVEPEIGDQPLHHRGDTGVHGAAQHEELAGVQVEAMSAMAAGTALRSGLRCSSMGVPITTTTCSTSAITSRRARRPEPPGLEHLAEHLAAPGSSKGMRRR